MGSTRYRLESRPPPSLLSLIVPCYNEAEVLPMLRSQMSGWLGECGVDWEVVLINDGSSDETLDHLVEWAEVENRIKVLHLARNFGHQTAVTAGLDAARGDAIVIIDADLQDPLDAIHQMLERYREGYDVVYGQRLSREGESRGKRWSAWLFYRFMRLFVHSDLPPDVGDFRLVSKRFAHALLRMRETHRFLRGMIAWAGYPQCAVRYHRSARAAGQTKYPLRRMLSLALTASLSFSPAPIRAVLAIGFALWFLGVGYGLLAVGRVILGLYVVPGWTSLMVVLCLIGGGVLISLGIVGEYVARIFEEVKDRPLYLVSDQYNLD